MRALKIDFQAGAQGLRLPLAYFSMLQGFLYSCWKEKFPKLHDEKAQFKPFLFSMLHGDHHIEGKDIIFQGAVRFEVRSIRPELIEELAEQLQRRLTVRLGQRERLIVNLEAADRLLFTSCARIQTLGPVTVHWRQNGEFPRPDEPMFHLLLARNLETKLEATQTPALSHLGFRPEVVRRKFVTKFKGTMVTGYDGTFLIEADPQAMMLLYYAGLGDRGSDGFGMFRICN